MSELLIAAFTALLGVIVFVSGQFMQRFLLEPILEQRKIIAEVAYAIVYYANVFGPNAPPNKIEDAQANLRQLAARLRATAWTIPLYQRLAALGWIPKRENIIKASTGLIGLSNSVSEYGGKNEYRNAICDALDIDWKGIAL